jgi:hypothetical protein
MNHKETCAQERIMLSVVQDAIRAAVSVASRSAEMLEFSPAGKMFAELRDAIHLGKPTAEIMSRISQNSRRPDPEEEISAAPRR